MTMPNLMNCPHDDNGWCLTCVGKLAKRSDYAETVIKKLGEPLLFLATGRPEDNVSPGLHQKLALGLIAYEEWIAFDEQKRLSR